jgi:hypothetical protein
LTTADAGSTIIAMTRLVACVLVLVTSVAHADDGSQADAKFEEAQKLREQGKVKEACEAFAASLALNPNAIGTILNVARCAEESGRTGSAVRWFTGARARAREQGLDPQRQAAEEHLAKLVDHVPHLSIAFVEPPPPDAKIVVDDQLVDMNAAADVIVDPTTIKVVVSAPGRVSFETTVAFDPKGDHEREAISVPKLGYPVTVKNTRRTVGKVMTIGGGVIVVGSVLIGYLAKRQYDGAVVHCSTAEKPVCNEPDYGTAKEAIRNGNIGTGVGIAGIGIVVAGAALWFLSPSHEEHGVAIVPVLGPTEAGIAAIHRF